jgi:hypothetical protein
VTEFLWTVRKLKTNHASAHVSIDRTQPSRGTPVGKRSRRGVKIECRHRCSRSVQRHSSRDRTSSTHDAPAMENQERSLRVIHRRGDTRRRMQCVLRPAARKSSEPRQRRRGLRGRQTFGASAGKICRNQKAGMAHDSRDGFGSIRRETHGKKTQTRCSRGRSEGNTARDPRPAAAPAGRAKKKATGAALREKARIPLRHTAGELKNEGAAARVRKNPSESKNAAKIRQLGCGGALSGRKGIRVPQKP